MPKNSLFTPDGVLDAPMRELSIALRDPDRTSIVLAIVEDPFALPDDAWRLRQESMGELAERLFGAYTLNEYNFYTQRERSLPRFCRTLRNRPAAVFAYGLETLAENDRDAYLNALELLNQQREDIRDTQTALVLWVTEKTAADLERIAPDFTMWKSASVLLTVKQNQDVPVTALGAIAISDADEMRRQALRYEGMLTRPNLSDTLSDEYEKQLRMLLSQLGRTTEIRGQVSVETQEGGHAAGVKIGKIDASNSINHFHGSVSGGESAPKISAEKLSQIRTRYLEFMRDECKTLNPRGVNQTLKTVTVPLDEVYVSLVAEREERNDFKPAPLDDLERIELEFGDVQPKGWAELTRLNRKKVSVNIALPEAVRASSRIILLGAPGSGKTTLTRFLASLFANASLENQSTVSDKEGAEYGETRIPIRIRIADYSSAFRQKSNLSLEEFFPLAFKESHIPSGELAALFQDAFNNGNALVLLDGLDEIAEAGIRREIADRIDRFVRNMGGNNRLLVTSRIVGYQEAQLDSSFETYRLQDMDREQIERFLHRWCVAVERFQTPDGDEELWRRKGVAEAEPILTAVDTNPGVQRVATNPLLLTVLALIHRNGARIPERRIDLYKTAAETLLRDWRLYNAGSEAREVSEIEVEEMLGPLAYKMHESEETGRLSEKELRDHLCELHSDAKGLPAKNPDIRREVDDFLRRVKEHTGLLVEHSPGVYGFMHLTFEEYFASREMVASVRDAPKLISAHRHDPRWEEVLLLAIAQQRPKDASYLIRSAIWCPAEEIANCDYEKSQLEDELHRDLFLAAKCLRDCTGVEPSLSRSVANEIVKLCLPMNRGIASLQNSARTAIGYLQRTEAGEIATNMLLESLKDEDANVRSSAADALGNAASTPNVVEALLNALKDDYFNVRSSAVRSLANATSNPNVVEAFLNSLRDVDEVRHSTLIALRSATSNSNVVGALLNALNDEKHYVRSFAASALANATSNPNVVEALLNALKDDWFNVRSAVARSLANATWNLNVDECLLNALKDEHGDVRNSTLSALRNATSNSNVIEALLNALNDEDAYVRSSAASALGNTVSNSNVAEALLNSLQDKDDFVRSSAASSLGNFPSNPDVLKALLKALENESDNVRSSAASALGNVVSTQNVEEALLNALRDNNEKVRSSAARALGKAMSNPKVVEALLNTLKDDDFRVRDSAWESLEQMMRNGLKHDKLPLYPIESTDSDSSKGLKGLYRKIKLLLGVATTESK